MVKLDNEVSCASQVQEYTDTENGFVDTTRTA